MVSKQRVRDYGEVYTPEEIVSDMLDQFGETNLYFYKVYDPACGNGNFLAEALRRKLKKCDIFFVSQLHGIAGMDILPDNVSACKERLIELIKDSYRERMGGDMPERDIAKATGILDRQIICGNALVDKCPMPVCDIVIGNPPYQKRDGGGGSSAVPLYHKFVQMSKKLNPFLISMIMPSRWLTGTDLEEFRTEMLNDRQLRRLVDYPDSSQCFPGTEIMGGVCHFLWSKGYDGDCEVKNVIGNNASVLTRPLLEKNGIFIRYNEAVSVLGKVKSANESSFSEIVSPRIPFGFKTTFSDFSAEPFEGSAKIYATKTTGYVSRDKITRNMEWVDKWKVYITFAYGGGQKIPHRVINQPFVGEPNSCCTETYLVIGPFKDEKTAANVAKYMGTKFFRFLVMLLKPSQSGTKKVYEFVPMQDFGHEWSDVMLYEKYRLDMREIEFIEAMVL